ncbi:FAD-dependent monooxygenase [Xanthomonas sp. PPL568]|uniref:FAD-dependent oxidoreductase n=1 Tax=Xanthomonas indica TaxID=2912242 RepID=UPI001F5738BB|nr:NAD(P)/FAD-dependent oxidoreductase [Xanthomonas indica]MCI2243627.1 FAD-dependent monooxygenase [Xanthomonas indica]
MRSPTPTRSTHPSVAIVGGGPAGLTAAAILNRHRWAVSVFEGDASLEARDQGGTLDLHPEDGQLALHKAGLLERFKAIARYEDQEQRSLDHATGAVLREEVPLPGTGDRPEIDRLVLRRLLLEATDGTAIRWDSKVTGVIGNRTGGYRLQLQDGLTPAFDIVIGADGAWSRVRSAVTPVVPAYTGVTFVELWLSEVDTRHPQSAALVGHGTMFALHGPTGIIAQRNGGGTIRVYAAFRTGPEHGDWPDTALQGIDKPALLARFDGWSAMLRRLIADADHIAAMRPIVALPPGLRWPHRSGLALVGDAAHVMPPLGVGVNLAMLDAAELAEALVGAADWRDAMRRWEVAMLDRAAGFASLCREGFAEMFPDAAPLGA